MNLIGLLKTLPPKTILRRQAYGLLPAEQLSIEDAILNEEAHERQGWSDVDDWVLEREGSAYYVRHAGDTVNWAYMKSV